MRIYRLLSSILFIVPACMALSCTEDGPDNPGDGPEPVIGSTIMVSNEAGETKISMEFTADWTVSNESPWFVVTPRSGEAGIRELTITTLNANTDLQERVSSFQVTVTGEETPVQYYVIQEATPGYSLPENASITSTGETTYTFTLGGNVAYEAVSDAEWLTVNSVTYNDSTLLADNTTYSKYVTSQISVSVTANDGDIRTAVISLNGADGETNSSLELLQMGDFVADYSKSFKRRSLAIKFTETWCQNCPTLTQGVEDAMKGCPDRIVPVNMHSSEAGLRYPNVGVLRAFFNNFTSYPSLFFNYYADVPCNSRPSKNTEAIESLTEEATAKLPSNTVLGGLATSDGSTVNLSLYVASKEAGDYFLCVFLLEDGLLYPQTGAPAGADYYHNDIVRIELTDNPTGDQVALSANSIYSRDFSLRIPSSVENADNIHIAAYLYRAGSYTGSVTNMEYVDFGYVVDNAVDIPINALVNFAYEE